MSKPMISIAGIRGIVGDSLRVEEFLKYVLAFGTLCEGGPVVVGCDSRLSREMMRNLAFAGLSSAGCDIHDLGLAATPTVGFMVRELGARGGIAITASHNPSEWNAYKFMGASGTFLSTEENKALLDLAESGDFLRADFRNIGKIVRNEDAVSRHLAKILEVVDENVIAAHKFRVAVDCVNGVGEKLVRPLLDRFDCEVCFINTDVNAEFPRNPEPLPENLGRLCDVVRETKSDVGFAIDPDADRLAIVDNTGRAIGEERTVTLASLAVLRVQPGPIVVNLSTTRAIDDVAERFDVPVYRTAIGEAHVVARIRESNAVVGGEGNGGVIQPSVHPGRDAAMGIALILNELAARNLTIEELNGEVPDYVMLKQRFDAEGVNLSSLYVAVAAEFRDALDLLTVDGAKAVFADSWVHVRASGTEPIVRVFAEAPTREAAEKLVQRVKDKVLPKAIG